MHFFPVKRAQRRIHTVEYFDRNYRFRIRRAEPDLCEIQSLMELTRIDRHCHRTDARMKIRFP